MESGITWRLRPRETPRPNRSHRISIPWGIEPESGSRHRPELVSIVDDAGLAFLTQFPERGLDLHPDLDVLRLDVDQLRGEGDSFLHRDDRHHVRLLHLELGRPLVGDSVPRDA